MFKTERVIPGTSFDTAKVDSASTDDDHIKVFTRGRRRLFVHGEIDVEGRTTTNRSLSWRHYSRLCYNDIERGSDGKRSWNVERKEYACPSKLIAELNFKLSRCIFNGGLS
jgi:hypothetical protein